MEHTEETVPVIRTAGEGVHLLHSADNCTVQWLEVSVIETNYSSRSAACVLMKSNVESTAAYLVVLIRCPFLFLSARLQLTL